jgi:hypothetical protein
MPNVSQAQRGAMAAAKAGKSTLGIPQSVGQDFMAADAGGELPAYAPKRKGDKAKAKGLSALVKKQKSSRGY